MGAKNFNQSFVFGEIVVDTFEFVTAGAERATGRMAQLGNGFGRFEASIDELFAQCADDTVAPGKDFADAAFVCAGRFNHAAGRCVDDGGNTARLCVERIFPRSGR